MKFPNTYIGVALASTLAASFCCITPLLGMLAGLGGFASSFAWLDSARPLLVGFTVVVLGLAWYKKLKPHKKADNSCACSSLQQERTGIVKYLQSWAFLGITTVFALALLAFPYYSSVFYEALPSSSESADTSPLQKVAFRIEGMTCTSCEHHVNHAIRKVVGVVSTSTSHSSERSLVVFDETQTNVEAIENAIRTTGYSVTVERNR